MIKSNESEIETTRPDNVVGGYGLFFSDTSAEEAESKRSSGS